MLYIPTVVRSEVAKKKDCPKLQFGTLETLCDAEMPFLLASMMTSTNSSRSSPAVSYTRRLTPDQGPNFENFVKWAYWNTTEKPDTAYGSFTRKTRFWNIRTRTLRKVEILRTFV